MRVCGNDSFLPEDRREARVCAFARTDDVGRGRTASLHACDERWCADGRTVTPKGALRLARCNASATRKGL